MSKKIGILYHPINNHPEAAKYDWEKEFVKEKKEK
jgi:hypothetical protein